MPTLARSRATEGFVDPGSQPHGAAPGSLGHTASWAWLQAGQRRQSPSWSCTLSLAGEAGLSTARGEPGNSNMGRAACARASPGKVIPPAASLPSRSPSPLPLQLFSGHPFPLGTARVPSPGDFLFSRLPDHRVFLDVLPSPCPAPHSPCPQRLPCSVDVGVEVPLRGLARAHAVARVVVGEDVAVDAGAQPNVEAAHLPQVHGVAVREKHCVPAAPGRDGHSGLTGDSATVPPRCPAPPAAQGQMCLGNASQDGHFGGQKPNARTRRANTPLATKEGPRDTPGPTPEVRRPSSPPGAGGSLPAETGSPKAG